MAAAGGTHGGGTVAAGTAGKPLRPLDAAERRVLGVLIEKGKTTPDQYPLSLNAVVTGANQKSNRDPVMDLDEEAAARALKSLRESGAVAEVYGSGRLARYRHLAYEWLGVGKEELAIVGELLLRGEQTEGDLRGRASRMDPIPDLTALRTHLDRLADRGLVVWLSPPGRGRLLTHGLLPPEKLEKVRSQLGLSAPQPGRDADEHDDPARDATASTTGDAAAEDDMAAIAEAPPPRAPATRGATNDSLVQRLEALEADMADLRGRLERIEQGRA
jgi:uncharacterized protein